MTELAQKTQNTAGTAGTIAQQHKAAVRIAFVGLFAAFSYVVFTFLQIKIYVGGDATSFHLGNAVVAIGALLLGGFWGGLGGAIGMTIGDLLDPVYIFYAPKTFICKLLIGLVTGFVGHRLLHISEENDKKALVWKTIVASACGLGINIIADPGLGYIYKRLIMGKSAADAIFTLNLMTTTVNAALSVVATVLIYLAVRGPLKKAGLLPDLNR
jgi:uncharacterized membrane protein